MIVFVVSGVVLLVAGSVTFIIRRRVARQRFEAWEAEQGATLRTSLEEAARAATELTEALNAQLESLKAMRRVVKTVIAMKTDTPMVRVEDELAVVYPDPEVATCPICTEVRPHTPGTACDPRKLR